MQKVSRAPAWFGISLAIMAAVLFGVATPLKKVLLEQVDPWMMSSLLNLGAGIGLALIYGLRQWINPSVISAPGVQRQDWLCLGTGILFGSVLAPVLVIFGLISTSASLVSLLLNLEGVATAVIAWIVFREKFSWRLAAGIVAIVVGSAFLTWTNPAGSFSWGALATIAACLSWGVDNNLTRLISNRDSLQVATIRSSISALISILIALWISEPQPTVSSVITISILGFFVHGVCLLCFILALRYIGACRTGAYFSLMPFVGALTAILFLGEQPPPYLLVTLVLMMLGVWLCITEQSSHQD